MFSPDPGTWSYLTAWAERRLRAARAELEGVNCSHDRAQALRGEIGALKDLLDLPGRREPEQERIERSFI